MGGSYTTKKVLMQTQIHHQKEEDGLEREQLEELNFETHGAVQVHHCCTEVSLSCL